MTFARFLLACALAFPAAAQFTLEPAGPCTAEGVQDAIKAALEPNGHRVKEPGGAVLVEVWLAKAIPNEKPADQPRGSDFPTLPVGALVGVIRYAKAGGDFRGQPIQPGVYTMRFNLQPEDGDHQGASPRRDHVLLTPASVDADPNSRPGFDDLVAMSRKASGTAHPQVLFLMAPESAASFPSVHHAHGREALLVKGGSQALGIVVVGKAEE
jgi:hypothetical protein